MQLPMAPTNPRKRAAPGASPDMEEPLAQQQQAYTAPNQGTSDELLHWTPSPEAAATTFPDPVESYNLNTYGEAGISQGQYTQMAPATSTQLARRPMNRQLVSTGRSAYGEGWGAFGNDALLDPSDASGMLENADIEVLEEKAAMAKRDAQSKRKSIPPFVQKLSSFLEDESKHNDLIRWSQRGDSFVVLDEDEFAKTLIPELFKHNNYASFVRQLNMYGFHKRVGLSDNSMKASERKNKSPSEYYNPYFKRGRPNLLWLINKPKTGNQTHNDRDQKQRPAKGAGNKRSKGDTGHDSEEEGKEGVDGEVYGNYGSNMSGQSRAISAAPESGTLQRRDFLAVQNQLAEFQKNQAIITNTLNRLRRDHNTLYQQSVVFQNLHDRHEKSINAILTFLASIFNRSLDGQGPQHFQEMPQNFANNQTTQHGSVVDMGEVNNQHPESRPGSPSPHRKAHRLLMAPPTGRASTLSPVATPNAEYNQGYAAEMHNGTQHGAIEELFDPPAKSPRIKVDPEEQPRQEMMDLINNTNAQATQPAENLDLPEMLSQYETQTGNSPLTLEQRTNMLSMIASQVTGPNVSNALVSPSPVPDLAHIRQTEAEIEELFRLTSEQDARLANAHSLLQPLSPSGAVPGLENTQYFNGEGTPDLQNSNLDLDQYLDSGAYYTNGSPVPDFNYENFNNDAMETSFDFVVDGVTDSGVRIIETSTTSESATPDSNSLLDANTSTSSGESSPSKKRRKA